MANRMIRDIPLSEGDHIPPRRTGLLSRIRSTELVFRYDENDGVACEKDSPDQPTWINADRENVESIFDGDRRLAKLFQNFLQEGCIGLVLVQNRNWICYGWMSIPGKSPPPQLPRWIRELDVYWIFYCHTREGFRGRGHYKRLLRQLVGRARNREARTEIYIDTQLDNIASRRAITATGFRPCGMIETYKFWIPRLGDWVIWGTWTQRETHPCPPSSSMKLS
jgi:RimJ/RimL family protein N-acetyltransferase